MDQKTINFGIGLLLMVVGALILIFGGLLGPLSAIGYIALGFGAGFFFAGF